MAGFEDYFSDVPPVPQQGPVGAAPTPTGNGNWFTAALGSGVHSLASEAGSGGEALARAVGFNGAADAARDYAATQRQTAATYQRPDLENAPWYNPEAIAYRTVQGLPTWGAALAGAGVGAALAPEAGLAGVLGGAAAMLPSAIGGNVQRREDYAGHLDQSNALKAIGLGVPEAAIQGLAPHYLESGLLRGFGGSLASTMTKAALIQAPVAGLTEWGTQAMGDPNRSLADRAHGIVQAALSGGILGAATGAVAHPFSPAPVDPNAPPPPPPTTTATIASQPAATVSTGSLMDAVTAGLGGPPPSTVPAGPGDIFKARMMAAVNANARQQAMQGPPEMQGPMPNTAIQMPPPADEAARLQQVALDARRGARPVTRAPGDLAGRMAAVGGAVEGPGQPPVVPPLATTAFGSGRNGMVGPDGDVAGAQGRLAGPPPVAGLLPAPTPTPEAPFDWAAQSKVLRQNKAFSNIVKGPFASRDDLVTTVFNNITQRLDNGEGSLPKSLTNAGKVLGILDEKLGQFTPEFAARANAAQEAAARPPGITAADDNAPPIAGPGVQAPDRLDRAEIDLKHQGRWDALEAQRNRLLGDNLSDPNVQGLLQQTADLQNSLLKPGRTGPTSWRNIDRTTQSIAAQVDARSKDAAVTPTTPTTDPTAPATGPEPSPAAAAIIAKTKPSPRAVKPAPADAASTPEVQVGAPPNGQTQEAKARAARKGKAAAAAAPEVPAPAVETPPATLKDADAKAAVAAGEAPPGLTAEEVAAARPNPAFTSDTTVIPREQGIERDGRYWDYLKTAHPDDVEARAQTAEQMAPLAEHIVNAAPPLGAETRESRAKAARAAMVAKRPALQERVRQGVENGELRDAIERGGGKGTIADNVSRRGALDEQHTAEVVRPKLEENVDAVDDSPSRVLDPEVLADKRILAAREANEQRPPLVDPSVAAGFQREGRKTQVEVRRQSMIDGLRARLAMIESSRRPMTPVPGKVTEQLDRAHAALTKVEQSGAILPTHSDFTAKDQAFQKMIAQHREQLDLVDRAVKTGGMEGLREVPRDFFGTDLYDDISGHVTPQTEKALSQHATAESQLQDSAAMARGERPLVRYMSPPTQQDVDLGAIIRTNATTGAPEYGSRRQLSDVLDHLRQHGTTPNARLLAHKLIPFIRGTTIGMDDGGPQRRAPKGWYVAGHFQPNANHISIMDGSKVEATVLHEAMHAATEYAVRANTPATQELRGLLDRVKARSPGNGAYGLTNVSEFIAEGFSNPEFQQFLRTEPAIPGSRLGSMWKAFKDGVANVLGLTGRSRSVFHQLIDSTNRLMGENMAEARPDTNARVLSAGQQVSELSDQVGNALMRKFTQALDNRETSLKEHARRGALGMMTSGHIGEIVKDRIPEAAKFVGLDNHKGVRSGMLLKYQVAAINDVSHLPKPAREAWNRLAQRSADNLDAFKKFSDHTWLKGHPQEAVLAAEHAEAVKDADILRRTPHGEEVWKASVDANMAAQNLRNAYQMSDLKERLAPDEIWPGFHNDPIREFEQTTGLHDDPAVARAWGDARIDHQLMGMKVAASDYENTINTLTAQRDADAKLLPGAQGKLTAEQHTELNNNLNRATANRRDITDMLSDVAKFRARSKQGAYFHLGREGDHFVTAHVISNNGVPDEAATQKVAERMAAAGFDQVISKGSESTSIYVRVQGERQREQLFDLYHTLKDEGAIDPAKPIARGNVADSATIYKAISPFYMRQVIEAAEMAKPEYPAGTSASQMKMLDEAHANQVRELKRSLMQNLPDTSLTKIYQKRENVKGFDQNMINSYKAAAIANARGLANMSLARELGTSSAQMNKELRSLYQNQDVSGSQLSSAAASINELTMREKLYQMHVPSTFMDSVRRMVHTFQIGASPAYFMTLMSQIPTLTLPELAKTHGYARSSIALARTASEAFKVMRAVAGGEEGLSFGMREADLLKAGVNPNTVKFLMQLEARGAFNSGAYTEAMTGHQTSGVMKEVTERANVIGRYAEQFPRILTALAARDLHMSAPNKAGGMDVHDFAYNKVNESQFNWNPELNARQTTRSGSFGAMSPLINQFMGFHIRMTEKLYREMADGFGKTRLNETDAQAATRRSQSRTWLLGHAAAVTMLAGTLGLPMVGVAASVYDRLADWWENKDNNDVTASYRTFLAHNMGKEMGEAIARGAPRLAGVDFDHLGEGTIAPGSSLVMMMTEKRKLEDAEKDWLKNMAGSSMGFLFNVAAAGRDFSNGDVLNGMVRVMPEIIKNGLEAYRIEKRGFVDKNGFKLGITPTAADIAMKAMGIDPAKEAEYEEVRGDAIGLAQMRSLRSQNITRHLLLASNQHNPAMLRTWQQEAINYGRDHPGMMNPLQEFSRELMMHTRNAAIAHGMGTPLGVNIRDRSTRELTSFGNLRDGAQ